MDDFKWWTGGNCRPSVNAKIVGRLAVEVAKQARDLPLERVWYLLAEEKHSWRSPADVDDDTRREDERHVRTIHHIDGDVSFKVDAGLWHVERAARSWCSGALAELLAVESEEVAAISRRRTVRVWNGFDDRCKEVLAVDEDGHLRSPGGWAHCLHLDIRDVNSSGAEWSECRGESVGNAAWENGWPPL